MTNSRRYLTHAAATIAAVATLYFVAAYVIVPALWARYEHQPGLAARPMLTVTAQGIPGDPLNVGLVGSRAEIVRAMTRAGWHPADPITLRTSLEIGVSVVLDRAYADAPVSSLFYDGRRQDLAFEKPVGRSPTHRHHVRLWLALASGVEGREVWLGAASYDRSVGLSYDTGQITHHIDADLDAERAFVIRSLADTGGLEATYPIWGIGPTLNGRNGGGDFYFTDGEVIVGIVNPKLESIATPASNPAPAVSARHRLWSAVIAVGRFLRILPQPHREGTSSYRDGHTGRAITTSRA
jgi:LssY C-terminus